MSEIQRPSGMEFRQKLQEREDALKESIDRTKVQPQDVLFAAQQSMLSDCPPKGAVLVCWYTPGENGRSKLKWSGWQDSDCQMKALAAEMAAWLVSP